MSKRVGPRIVVERWCGGCIYLRSEYYTAQSDSGFEKRCDHPSGARHIGTSERTPEWCPEVVGAGRGAAEVELRSPTGPAFTAGDGGESPRTPIDLASEASGGVCEKCGCVTRSAHACHVCDSPGRSGGAYPWHDHPLSVMDRAWGHADRGEASVGVCGECDGSGCINWGCGGESLTKRCTACNGTRRSGGTNV